MFADDVVLLKSSDRTFGWGRRRESTSKSEVLVLCRKMVDCFLQVGSVLMPWVVLFMSDGPVV